MSERIREQLAQVQERIVRAAARAGRKAEDITLIAVSKTFDSSVVQQAVDAGVRDLGENRVQEAATKKPDVHGQGLRWHLIGHLQSNKAKAALSLFDVIHTIDTPQLASRLNRIAGEMGRRPEVLVQVDLGGEPTKSGAEPKDLPEIIETLDNAEHLDLRGLMTLPPFFEAPDQTRSYFRSLYAIMEELNRSRAPEKRLTELSMGMSHDFEVAIQEGA
ncbi:MAG TPA: YggS family pyridoxal phosphate-dependent enzyme, partial [Blastocatellia bacterium]|nr:YggS family pyridoxal phosphate-dependent enzyme [Blastocatellia bacterium]